MCVCVYIVWNVQFRPLYCIVSVSYLWKCVYFGLYTMQFGLRDRAKHDTIWNRTKIDTYKFTHTHTHIHKSSVIRSLARSLYEFVREWCRLCLYVSSFYTNSSSYLIFIASLYFSLFFPIHSNSLSLRLASFLCRSWS